MRKSYKICLFVVIFIAFLALGMHFLPSSKKELLAEKEETKEDSIIDEQNLTENNDIENKIATENSTDLNISDKIESKEIPPVTSEKALESKNDFEIKQKLVSWGYSSSKNRNIDTIIIHSSYNALGGDKYDLDKLISEYKEYGVAPHYLIDRSGNIYQLVSAQNIAYHAGESKMPDGRTNVNNFSLGIEIMTTESDSPTDAQYASLTNLISYIKGSYKIKNILGHSQIASGRKTDPWNFSWSKID